jgi:hypothetical protein
VTGPARSSLPTTIHPSRLEHAHARTHPITAVPPARRVRLPPGPARQPAGHHPPPPAHPGRPAQPRRTAIKDLRPPCPPRGRSCRRAGAALAAAALAALALAITGTGAALAAPRASTATAATTPGCAVTTVSDATWMDDLTPCLQDHKLSQIVIPGSHDSLTYSFGPIGAGFATTQDQNITQQLNDGMRAFDIRVGWQNNAYYAEHGDRYGPLKLPNVLTSIAQWATQPGHEHEIIRLALDINQNTTGPFPTAACQAFGNALGGSLLTPSELQAHFGTIDVGQVTLGQLWSLPDPSNAARVIIDGSDQCMDAAANNAAAGTWTPSSAYYADWCGPATVTNLLVQAAQQRATEGPGGPPIPLGPPQPGGLYELDIQMTPASPGTCLTTPQVLAPAQTGFLNALENAWETSAAVRNNLNLVLGDYVETIPLAADAIAMDEWLNIGVGAEVAFQANTGSLWSTGTDNHGNWAQEMKPGTSPSITVLPSGGYEMAYQDNNGHLWTTGTAGTTEWGLANVMVGTSPAITDLYGGGYEVAYQDNTGILQTVGSGPGSDSKDWGAGMKVGTSPAITYQAGGYEIAFQANTGHLWTCGSTSSCGDSGLGMMAGTSPAITSLAGGGYEMAFQANTGNLWSVGSGGGSDNHGNWNLGMKAGTSPAITGLRGGGYEMAFQASNGNLWSWGSGSGSDNHGDWSRAMMAGTSPAITGLLGGGYVMAFQGPRGYLWTDGSAGAQYWGLGMMAGTSPSIESPIFGIG